MMLILFTILSFRTLFILYIFDLKSQLRSSMVQNSFARARAIFFIVLASTFLSSSVCQLKPNRLKIIDSNQNHCFVRGNLPIKDNAFQVAELYTQLSKLTGFTNFRVVVYSFLNFLTAKQTKNRYIQENFFGEEGQKYYNLSRIQYVSNPIYGSFVAPSSLPPIMKKYALKYYNLLSLDNIPKLLTRIEANMNSPFKTVVYIHCSQGFDRAGYVAAAYKMKNHGVKLIDAHRQNLEIIKQVRGHMHFNSFNALQWYCLYLKRSEEECLIFDQKVNSGNSQH